MVELPQEPFEQKIGYARASLWSPFWAVGMVARVKGHIPSGLLEGALRKLRTLHPPLAGRVQVEEDGTAWVTTEGVGDFALEVRPMTSSTDWAGLFLEQERLPFAFGAGPVTRFFLLTEDGRSDVVAVAPHVVCDGYSMAHAMGDLVALLNEPGRAVAPPAPPAATWQNVAHSAGDDLLLRGMVWVVNRVWRRGQAVRDVAEYQALHGRFWARQQHGLAARELPPEQTAGLVARCREHGVSVTAALAAALLQAQAAGPGIGRPVRQKVAVPVSVRDRMVRSPGREVGVYASSVDVTLRAPSAGSFWELAKRSHRRLRRALGSRARVLRPLVLEGLNPAIADGMVAALSADWPSPAYRLLARLTRMKGSAHRVAVSNIGRIELPDLGSPYRLEGLIPLPPIGPGSGLMLNVLTLGTRMNLVLKYRQPHLDGPAASALLDRVLAYLLEA